MTEPKKSFELYVSRPDCILEIFKAMPPTNLKITGLKEEVMMRHGKDKTTFETGAQRDTDEGKGSPSLISPVLIHRLGVLLAKGAEHYGADNWMKGMP